MLPDAAALRRTLADRRDALPPTAQAARAVVTAALDRLAAPATPGLGGPAPAPALHADALAAVIDHTQLRPEASPAAIDRLCDEARAHGFGAVCVAPTYVARAADALAGTATRVAAVVGFPHGTQHTATKAFDAGQCVADGAHELDMVLPLGRLKAGAFAAVEADIRAVVEAAADAAARAAHGAAVPVKVILETALLSDDDIALGCVLAARAGAAFVKTSTGFAAGGATPGHVALLRQMVGGDLGVKAAGGIRTADDARQMLAHGATRLGASGSVALVEGAPADADGY